MEDIGMSIKEANRLSIMKQIDKKFLTLKKASEELSVSLRQTKRIRKRYFEQGAKGLISLKRGKQSNRKISSELRTKVLELAKTKYIDFGPTLLSEKLIKLDQIKISAETLRKWLIEEGLRSFKKKKEIRLYQRRTRRSRFGELLQGDGSPHDWLEGRGPKCTLLHFVDDATSTITVGQFFPVESTEGYLEILQEHLKKYGRPLELYVDKHSVFRVNREEIKKGIGITHFGQVVKDLQIKLICANSPQAKGRIERKNGVLQDRLTKELRLRGINTIKDANKFLPQFIEEMNQKFGKRAIDSTDAHRALRSEDNLRVIFARKEKRKLSKDLTFQYKGMLYLVQTKTPNRLRHAAVNVLLYRKGEPIEVYYNENKLEYKKWAETKYEQPNVLDSKEIALNNWIVKKTTKPGKHHPWR